MKKVIFIMTCIFLTGLGFQSCQQDDKKIQTEVDKVVKENSSTFASVKDGVVTLTGTVATEQEKTAIENQVRSVKGVKSVTNNIAIQAPVPTETVTPTVNPDETIKSEINSKLSSGGYKDVKIEVSNGEVTLNGTVKRADLTKVMQIANEANPKKVNNNLNLK